MAQFNNIYLVTPYEVQQHQLQEAKKEPDKPVIECMLPLLCSWNEYQKLFQFKDKLVTIQAK